MRFSLFNSLETTSHPPHPPHTPYMILSTVAFCTEILDHLSFMYSILNIKKNKNQWEYVL